MPTAAPAMSASCANSSDDGNAPPSETSRRSRKYVAVMAIEMTPHVLTHADHSYFSPISLRSPLVKRLGFRAGSAMSSARGSAARLRGPT